MPVPEAARLQRGAPVRLPSHSPDMRIGLLGGSFNPPHEGHRLASRIALRALSLHRLWWLVSPGNPLKDARELAPMPARLAAARALADDPRIVVTDIEASIGTRYTHATLAFLTRHCPGVRFVWIMGADNLAGFHRWQRWRDIARLTPMAVIDRPGSTLKAAHTRAAILFARDRLGESESRLLANRRPPALVFLHGPRSNQSSTALRNTVRKNGEREASAIETG